MPRGRGDLAILAILACAPAASAQYTLLGLNAEGEVVLGSRFYLIKPSDTRTGKYEEYRDLPGGPSLDLLRLRLARPDESYAIELGGSKWGQSDAEFDFGVGRLGLWQFGLDYDQTPHISSTTARALAVEVDRGRWGLPTPRPALPTHNAGALLDEVSQRWATQHYFFNLTPIPEITLRADYTRIEKHGNRPGSMAFGSPGNNFYEVLAPIDQTVQDVRLRFSLARESWQIQAGYTFSMFQQGHRLFLADNPCLGLAGAIAAGGCAGDATGAPATGQVSLEPDNQAHTFSVGGGVNLPLRTRIIANVTYSARLQNESFLPHTINPAITSGTLALPQDSLNGFVGTTLINLQATSRPLPPLTLSARYRLFDLNDRRDEIIFPGHVVNDRTLVLEERLAGRWSYTKHNADLDAKLRVLRSVNLLAGMGWERWDRNAHREVPVSDEFTAKAGVDVTPADWLTARLVYKPSFRRIDDYLTFAHAEHTVVEELTASELAQGQSVLLRKFDEADRDRHAVRLSLHVFPIETVTTTLTGEWRGDEYINSPLGISVNTDTVDTFHVGANVGLIPGKLDWATTASAAYALGEVETRNVGALVSGSAAQRTTATAKRMPAFEDGLVRLDTWLRWYIDKAWTASVGYAFEHFWKHDWRTDMLNPFVPGVTSIWLGADTGDYSAHLVAVTLGYRFK